MEARRQGEGSGEYEPHGWCLGSEEFRQELLAQVSELAGPEDRGEDIRQSAEEKAERIVEEELGRLGWSGQDLAGRPKGDARKVKIAARLRRETTVTLAWIARRVQMGAPGHVSCLLYRKERTEAEAGDGKRDVQGWQQGLASLKIRLGTPPAEAQNHALQAN
jgi:hypothetical protein